MSGTLLMDGSTIHKCAAGDGAFREVLLPSGLLQLFYLEASVCGCSYLPFLSRKCAIKLISFCLSEKAQKAKREPLITSDLPSGEI